MSSVDPEDTLHFLSRVDALLEQRLFDPAQELAAGRLRQLPGDVDARIAMCKIWTRMGKLERVEEIMQELESCIADWARLYAAMGDMCRESGLKNEALRFYRRFLDLNPLGAPHPSVEEKLDRLMDAGACVSAPDEDHYEDIAEIAPDFHTVTLADLYLRQNQPEMARDVLREIVQREPHNQEAALRLREVDDRLSAPQGEPGRQERDRVLQELTRWLQGIGRIGSYAT